MSDLPFEIVNPPGWAAAVDSWTWSWLTDDHGQPIAADKRGFCPRCGHGMSISIGITEGITEGIVGPSTAVCNCAVAHSATQTGCGAYGEIEAPAP